MDKKGLTWETWLYLILGVVGTIFLIVVVSNVISKGLT